MTKTEKQEWAIKMYNEGVTVTAIAQAVGIANPTLYRWMRDREGCVTNPRKPKMWNDSGIPNPERQKSSISAWHKRLNDEQKELKKIKTEKQPNVMDVLHRLGLSLGVDNMGHYIHRGDDGRKVYLTEAEWQYLIKKPIDCLKTISGRINAGLKKEDGE